MIHWAFLILVFVVGFILGWVTLYHLARLAAEVETAIDKAIKGPGWRY